MATATLDDTRTGPDPQRPPLLAAAAGIALVVGMWATGHPEYAAAAALAAGILTYGQLTAWVARSARRASAGPVVRALESVRRVLAHEPAR
jgi:hypothetical protein